MNTAENYEQERESKQGDGDKIFSAAERLLGDLRSGRLLRNISQTVSNLRDSDVKSLNLPPVLEAVAVKATRALHGKVEDFKEVVTELKISAADKGEDLVRQVIEKLDLPTRADFNRLEKKLSEKKRPASSRQQRTR